MRKECHIFSPKLSLEKTILIPVFNYLVNIKYKSDPMQGFEFLRVCMLDLWLLVLVQVLQFIDAYKANLFRETKIIVLYLSYY